MLARVILRQRRALILVSVAIVLATSAFAEDPQPAAQGYAIRLIGTDQCGSTADLSTVRLRTPGLEDGLRKLGVRQQVRPAGITIDPAPIPREVLDVGAAGFGLKEKDLGYAPTDMTGIKFQFKDQKIALIAPYFFIDLGDVGCLTFQCFNNTNGRVILPPGFGVKLSRTAGGWVRSGELDLKEPIGMLSCLGAALETRNAAANPSPKGNIFILYEKGTFAPSQGAPTDRPHLSVRIAGLRMFESNPGFGSMSQAVAKVEGAADLTEWLAKLSALLGSAEVSLPIKWVSDGVGRPDPTAETAEKSTKTWSQLSYSKFAASAPVYVRAILPAKPISMVYFQSTVDSSGLFLYMVNDRDGNPTALIDPDSAMMEPKLMILESAARCIVNIDPAAEVKK